MRVFLHLIVKLFCLSIVSMNARRNHLLFKRPSNCKGKVVRIISLSLSLGRISHLQHRVVQLRSWFVHPPVDPWVEEQRMVADAGKEDFHDEGSVVEKRDSGGLEVHGEVGHVGLQLGEGLLALAPHVVLQCVHLDLGRR